jgi:hypothetical protein
MWDTRGLWRARGLGLNTSTVIQYVAQAGLQLMILLSLPPKCWDNRNMLSCLAVKFHLLIST